MIDILSKKADLLCIDQTSLIMDYLNRELNSETKTAFEVHLSGCPECLAILNTYRKTILKVQSLCKNTPARMNLSVRLLIGEKITTQSYPQ